MEKTEDEERNNRMKTRGGKIRSEERTGDESTKEVKRNEKYGEETGVNEK